MPISEDEFDNHRHGQNMPSGMSKAELRRSNKPIMEKRRRARINHCLNELKSLILDALKKDPARHSKLEKADILEMTVKHLQNIQKQQLAVAVATDPTVVQKFKSGFSECAAEVTRYINNIDGIETGVKQRLATHLHGCVSGIQQQNPQNTMTIPLGQATTIPLTISQGNSGASIQTGSPEDVNNNNNNGRVQVPAGIQLIPSRLPTGELALLVPNSSNLPFFNNAILGSTNFGSSPEVIQRNHSAFTSVRPSKTQDSYRMKMSPPLSPASSSTSYEEHQLDCFSRPRTPSPKEISISFPTPPGPFAFKTKESSPPQQFQISSTSISPENKPKPIEKVPITYQNVSPYSRNQSMEPISVITSRYPEVSRKRTNPEGLLALADQSTTKHQKLSDEAIVISSSSSPEGPSQFNNRPSTSNQQNEAHDSMWRPW